MAQVVGLILLLVFVGAPLYLMTSRGRQEAEDETAREADDERFGARREAVLDCLDRIRTQAPGCHPERLPEMTVRCRRALAKLLDDGTLASCPPFVDAAAWPSLSATLDPDALREAEVYVEDILDAAIDGPEAEVTLRVELTGHPAEDWVWACTLNAEHGQGHPRCLDCGAPLADDAAGECPSCGAEVVPWPGDWRVMGVTPLEPASEETTRTLPSSALLDACVRGGGPAWRRLMEDGPDATAAGAEAGRRRADFDADAFLHRVRRTVDAVYGAWQEPAGAGALSDFAAPDFASTFLAIAERRRGDAQLRVPEITKLHLWAESWGAPSAVLSVRLHGDDGRPFIEEWVFRQVPGAAADLALEHGSCRVCGAPRKPEDGNVCGFCHHALDGSYDAFLLAAIRPGYVEPDATW